MASSRQATDLPAARILPLGTGSILLAGGRSASAYLLEAAGQRILLDCGPGALLRLRQAAIDPASIDHVLISHYHPDHHADLLGLLFLRRNPALAQKAHLSLHGPPGLRNILAAWSQVYGSWIEHPSDALHEIDCSAATGVHHLGAVRVQAFAAKHSMPAYCYRLEWEGHSLAYSGDSDYCQALLQACAGVDHALIECSFPDSEPVEGHMTPSRVKRLLAAARPARAYLTHFYPPMFPLIQERTGLAAVFADLETELWILNDLEEICL